MLRSQNDLVKEAGDNAPTSLNSLTRKKGKYDLLMKNVDWSEHDDDYEDDFEYNDEEEGEFIDGVSRGDFGVAPRSQGLFRRNLFSDERFTFKDVPIVDGVAAVRFLKFLVLTLLGLVAVYKASRWLNAEHDEEYTLGDMILFDGNFIVMDTAIFFVVGRLYNQPGVDQLSWVIFMSLAAFYTSFVNKFTFLHHSVSLYEMHCRWPIELWAFVSVLVPLCFALFLLHVRYAWMNGILLMKLFEIALTLLLLLLPQVSSSNFHFHHWFAGWLVGMHCNFDTWWSRATMAWCWGCYVNGIAVYGRDPQLTCAYAYYLSTSQQCGYMRCYQEQIQTPDNHTVSVYKPLATPNWWNCSAEGNYSP